VVVENNIINIYMTNTNNLNSYGPPPMGFVTIVGGSKGRPTDPWLKACPRLTPDDVNPKQQGCTPARPNMRTMIMTNDWWYQKGSNSSTSLIHTTGSSLAAVRRRT